MSFEMQDYKFDGQQHPLGSDSLPPQSVHHRDQYELARLGKKQVLKVFELCSAKLRDRIRADSMICSGTSDSCR